MIKAIKKEAKLAGKCCECGGGRIVYELWIGSSGAAVPVLRVCNKCRRILIRKLRYTKEAMAEEAELEKRFREY